MTNDYQDHHIHSNITKSILNVLSSNFWIHKINKRYSVEFHGNTFSTFYSLGRERLKNLIGVEIAKLLCHFFLLKPLTKAVKVVRKMPRPDG